MKRCNQCIMWCILVAVMLMAIMPFAFIVYLELSIDHQSVSKVLKDHGSLIAGVLGVIGVAILVVFQKISNREIIENSRELIVLERKEAERTKFYLDLRDMERFLYKILYKINERPQDGSYDKVYDDFDDKLHEIIIFLKKYAKHYLFFELLREVAAYHRWIVLEKYNPDAMKYYCPDRTHIHRCSRLFDQVIEDYLNINQKEADHKRGWDDSYESIKKMREDFLDGTRKEFTDVELYVSLHYFYREYKSFIDKSVRL